MTSQLGELRIGPLRLDFPVVQAALSGYSDMPMRLIARRHGAPYTLCEVMLDKFIVELKPRRRNRHFLHVADEEHPTGGQLMGADPSEFGPAALRLVENGFDVIDINFGCPVKKVLGRCRGGFHLSQPAVALEIVRRVRDAVPPHIPVTVKMRRGIDDSAESREKFFEIFDGAYDAGRGGDHGPRPHGAAAVRWPVAVGVSPRAEAARRRARRAGQRRLVHRPGLPRHDRVHGRRWRDGRPRRDRQSVDLRAVPGAWPPASRCPTRRRSTSSAT